MMASAPLTRRARLRCLTSDSCAARYNFGVAAAPDLALTAEDRAILAKESPTVVGHTCKIIRLGSAVNVAELRTAVRRRITAAPALTWRLGGPPDEPCWVRDPNLELEAHIVDAGTVVPLSEPDFRASVAALFVQRLDRRRPLWRIDVLHPLSDGGSALVWRIHHALADGQTCARLAAAVLWDLPAEPASAQPTLARAAAQAERSRLRHRRDLPGVLAREMQSASGSSPFDGRIGTRRQVAFSSTSLPALHAAAKAVDSAATVNDAVLACVAGGLRRWLDLHRHAVRELHCKVPVSLHRADQELTNRDSFFYVSLPVTEADPLARLRAVSRETALRKRGHDAEELDRVLIRLGEVSPRLRTACDRFLFSPRRFAVNVSTVRGPGTAVSVLGVPVTGLYSLADIAERHALRIATHSLHEQLSFGFCADPDLVDNVDELAEMVVGDADELIQAAARYHPLSKHTT